MKNPKTQKSAVKRHVPSRKRRSQPRARSSIGHSPRILGVRKLFRINLLSLTIKRRPAKRVGLLGGENRAHLFSGQLQGDSPLPPRRPGANPIIYISSLLHMCDYNLVVLAALTMTTGRVARNSEEPTGESSFQG